MAEKRNINLEIAKIFYEIADILEIQNVKWKPQAYRIAAQTLESLSEDLIDIYKREGQKGIDSLPGIGERLTEKIIQYIQEGKIDEHERLKKTLPHGLYKMMNVPGIGAKKASLFYNKLGIKSVKELKKAAKQHKLYGLPGFKEKAEENILEGIALEENQKGRIPLKDAQKIADKILKELRKLPEIIQVEVAGSTRRKKSSVRDLDIIVKTLKPKDVIDKFTKMKFVHEILGKGHEKATIVSKDGIQVDIRVFDEEEFGAGLLYFTGDKLHNIWLRKVAIKKGLKLNEYGLFDKKTGKRIAGKTEEEVYNRLGLRFINPEKRIGEIIQ
jgi:DNA polymerase (family X)